ncbi:MAG: glycosyltransferase family 39 protein [Bacteroidales bacterium]|nr:glycosyltransferase family 39 protein [Bacteroidales bacterium]
MDKLSKYKNEIILAIIILIGCILRFYNCAEMSLGNDELSILSRLQYDNFKQLITEGVYPDGNPAGIQVFMYYWTKLFGFSVLSIRIPYIIAGIFSIFIIYLISSLWFNKQVGLFTAVSIAVLQFPLFYSQIARMYSIGLLFSLLTVYFWTKLLFTDNQKNIKILIAYILSSVACFYIHYFSFLFAIIVGLTGLLFLKRTNYKIYLIGLISPLILFLPHLKITLHQFGSKDVGLLSVPKANWLMEHILFVFNNSFIVLISIIVIITATVLLLSKIKIFSKFRIISLIWFLLPFLIGYFYSTYRNPVLQNSVLLFSFPYLLLFSFSFINIKFPKINYSLLGLYTAILLFSTIIEQKYYQTQHFGEFKKIAQLTEDWSNKYGEENITKTININQPYYINYYLNELGVETTKFKKYDYTDEEELLIYKKIIENSQTPYFLHAWSTKFNPEEIYDLIKTKYPAIIEQEIFFNSEIKLFGKNPADNIAKEPKPVAEYFEDFEDSTKWTGYIVNTDSACPRNSKYCYYFNDSVEYGLNYQNKIFDIYRSAFKKIKMSLLCKPIDDIDGVHIALSFHAGDSVIIWRGRKFDSFIDSDNWTKVFFTFELPKEYKPLRYDYIKIYIWNSKKKNFLIDDFLIRFYKL